MILEELLQAEAIEAQYTEEFYETEQIQQIQGIRWFLDQVQITSSN
ncbi:hypothetical protein [Bacillus thuringiensis]|nr:hypothetical protein [Bacillus thuringiensis]